jgi:hypothetical protein
VSEGRAGRSWTWTWPGPGLGLWHLYRNTFVGTVRVRNTDSADGPFDFTHNVIVNSGRGIRARRS